MHNVFCKHYQTDSCFVYQENKHISPYNCTRDSGVCSRRDGKQTNIYWTHYNTVPQVQYGLPDISQAYALVSVSPHWLRYLLWRYINVCFVCLFNFTPCLTLSRSYHLLTLYPRTVKDHNVTPTKYTIACTWKHLTYTLFIQR